MPFRCCWLAGSARLSTNTSNRSSVEKANRWSDFEYEPALSTSGPTTNCWRPDGHQRTLQERPRCLREQRAGRLLPSHRSLRSSRRRTRHDVQRFCRSVADPRHGEQVRLELRYRPTTHGPESVRAPNHGEKGIGRLAIAAIGPQVSCSPVPASPTMPNLLVAAFIHWGVFTLPAIDLNDVRIPVRTFPGGTLPTPADIASMVDEVRTNITVLAAELSDSLIAPIVAELDSFGFVPEELYRVLPPGPTLLEDGSGTHFHHSSQRTHLAGRHRRLPRRRYGATTYQGPDRFLQYHDVGACFSNHTGMLSRPCARRYRDRTHRWAPLSLRPRSSAKPTITFPENSTNSVSSAAASRYTAAIRRNICFHGRKPVGTGCRAGR